MKLFICLSLFVAVVVVQCSHTFIGTNVQRQLVFHKELKYSANIFTKRIENFNYTIPGSYGYGRSIQGILIYDLTKSGSSANVTAGGLGFNFVTLRMKSDRSSKIDFDVSIYA